MQCGLMIMLLILGLLVPRLGHPFDVSWHRQLVVVVTDSWNDSHATLYRFVRAGESWERTGKGLLAVVGKQGLAWDPALPEPIPGEPVKQEGDRRSPAGVFPLSLDMGFAPLPPTGVTLPYRVIAPGTHCVDDSASRYYNLIVAEKDLPGKAGDLWHSSERMWELSDLYRLLLVVDYNTLEPRPGAGSCIFLHIRRSGASATGGCTALEENDLAALMQWLRPEARPALVQLPREAYRRVWHRWQLPPPQLLEEETRKDKNDLVDVHSVAPEVAVEMRYAGSDNFTGQTIYDCGRCFLWPGTAAKVAQAERELQQKGLSLKMWDCYRPLSAQMHLWSLVPDPRFVADPRKGSRHNRGNAVDVTLVDGAGRELEMPTKFDDFSSRAGHGETRLPAHVLENRRFLAETMERAGFRRLATEWWHYDDADSGGDILDVPFGELCR